MREGSTLIRGKLPSREGCISDYLGYSATLSSASAALCLLAHSPISAVLGFLLVLLMPGAIIALPLAVLAVVYLCYALAVHWIEHSTAAPCHPDAAAKIRKELTAKLPGLLLVLPVTLIRGVFSWLVHPDEGFRCWHSYLTYPDNPNGAPGMFESSAGTLDERVRRYYVVGAIVAMGVFCVAPSDGPLLMVALFIIVAIMILTFLVPTLFVAPLFARLLSARQSPQFERALCLKYSPNPTEAQSIPLGTLLADGSPVLMPIKTLAAGLHLLGAPGSGKSTLLSFLAEYLLSFALCRVHFIDCKDQNSMELFEAMRIGAERAGVPFHYVTTDQTKASFTYNVFRQAFFRRMTPMQRASFIGAVLGCTHGLEGYGTKFFGGNAFSILLAVFTHYEIRSLDDLGEKIRLVKANPRAYGLDKETAKAATEVLNDVSRLAAIPVLNSDLEGIDLCDGLPKAVYYTFPAAYDVTGAFGRLIAFSLFAAADNTADQPMTWLIADEVQRIIGGRMEILLTQSREKMGCICANQSMDDLVAHDKDYRPTIRTCLRTRWELNLPNKQDQALQAEASGKVVRERESVSVSTTTIPVIGGNSTTSRIPRVVTSNTHSISEYEADRYGVNEVSLVNCDDTLSLMTCAQDAGFIQWGGFPQVVRIRPHISREEYERRKRAVWPEDGGPDTITPGIPEPKGPPQLPAPKAPTIINPGTEQRESRRSRRRRPPPPPNPPLA